MNKLIFAFLLVIGFLAVQNAEAGRYDSSIVIEAPVSSGAISGCERGCAVLAVYASSSSDSNLGNWFQLISTHVTKTNLLYSQFSTADHRSPAVMLPVSTITAGGGYIPLIYKVLDYGEKGLSFSTAPYVFKSAETIGNANRVWLEIAP